MFPYYIKSMSPKWGRTLLRVITFEFCFYYDTPRFFYINFMNKNLFKSIYYLKCKNDIPCPKVNVIFYGLILKLFAIFCIHVFFNRLSDY